MTDNQLKSLIGQNCNGYDAKIQRSIMRIGIANESCNSCYHYVAGQCTKNLYETMENIIKSN